MLIKTGVDNFNPRLREGGDESAMSQVAATMDFNPRLREGGDNSNHFALKLDNYFNPRLREGGDIAIIWAVIALSISIHASEKEATEMSELIKGTIQISIHASEKEATATYCDTSTIMYISSLNNFFVRYF